MRYVLSLVLAFVLAAPALAAEQWPSTPAEERRTERRNIDPSMRYPEGTTTTDFGGVRAPESFQGAGDSGSAGDGGAGAGAGAAAGAGDGCGR